MVVLVMKGEGRPEGGLMCGPADPRAAGLPHRRSMRCLHRRRAADAI